MTDCSEMSNLLGFYILCTVSIAYGSDIRCYICNVDDHPDCGVDGKRLITELNSTFLRPCSQTISICSLSYKITTAQLGNVTRRHSYARNCITRDEKANLQQQSVDIIDSRSGNADMVLVKDPTASNTKERIYFCESSGCNYKFPGDELEQQDFSISCYNCSSTVNGNSCGLILSAGMAERVLTPCSDNYLCLSSYKQDTTSLTRFDFNRTCVSETEVTLLKRIYGTELVGFVANSSDEIHYFVCDFPGCNDVFQGSNVTSVSCFVCNESTTICNDIEGRRLGTAAGVNLLRPCPTNEPHRCSVMLVYDVTKGLATKIDRQCMLTRMVQFYQQSGGEAPIIKTSNPNETFYVSFCSTTGCNRAYGRPDLLPKPTTSKPPNQSTYNMEVEMQKSCATTGTVPLTTLLTLIVTVSHF